MPNREVPIEEYRDVASLAEAVRRRLASCEHPLVGVDGAYGSGKSTLATALASQLGGAVLRVDDYTLRNGQPYRQQLRYEEIQRDLAARRSQGAPVLVDGICLLDVLDRVGAKPDLTVYVKKVEGSGFWHDQDTCDPEWIELESPLLQMPGAEVAREVAAYHKKRDPVSGADFLFVRITEG